jgi:hypothetical protein
LVPQTKQIADLITWSRAGMVPLLLWLGLTRGPESLPIVIIIVIYNWTADSIDGPLARKSLSLHDTWIGRRDLEIDMLFSTGLLIYLTLAGFVSLPLTTIYLLSWIILFWWRGIVHTLGVLYQAPIYFWFIIVTFRDASQFAWWLIAWIVLAIAITWPKFPKVIVPTFLLGLRNLFRKDQEPSL